jgi:hypothetical protein
VDPTPAPSWARGFFFNTFDLMSAHVKPPIATHFACPLQLAKGLGASCGAGTAPADLTVTGLAKALPYSWAEQESSIGFPQ